jgi:hypothetical protein
MVTDTQLSKITRISILAAVLLVMLTPLGHVIPTASAFNLQVHRQLFGGFSHAIASSSFDSGSNGQGSLMGSSPSTLAFSAVGTHGTNDGGSWYKHDQYNYKYNNYRGDSGNSNYNNEPHKKWHHHGSSSSGDLVINKQNADCNTISNANGGAGNGGSGGNAGGGSGGSSNGGNSGNSPGGSGGSSNGGSGSGASGGTSNGGNGSTTGSGGPGGASNGGNGGSSPGAPGVGGSSEAAGQTTCSNTSTFNLSRA